MEDPLSIPIIDWFEKKSGAFPSSPTRFPWVSIRTIKSMLTWMKAESLLNSSKCPTISNSTEQKGQEAQIGLIWLSNAYGPIDLAVLIIYLMNSSGVGFSALWSSGSKCLILYQQRKIALAEF